MMVRKESMSRVWDQEGRKEGRKKGGSEEKAREDASLYKAKGNASRLDVNTGSAMIPERDQREGWGGREESAPAQCSEWVQ